VTWTAGCRYLCFFENLEEERLRIDRRERALVIQTSSQGVPSRDGYVRAR
jgi:hypothetical protein